jgi:hypothetical protein
LIDDLAGLTDDVLDLIKQGRAADAPALTLLVRSYRATGREDLRLVLEPALGGALDQPLPSLPPFVRADHLMLLVEALPVADDGRLHPAIDSLVASFASGWGVAHQVESAAAGLDACLTAMAALDARTRLPDAIDELERLIGGAYKPGEGLVAAESHATARISLGDHVRAASALLTAYRITRRVPYAMLAEELMQFAKRFAWQSADASTPTAGDPGRAFALQCAAASVYCRLASLHASDEYREAAVIAANADYRSDAAAILGALSAQLPGPGFECAAYGLALGEWLGSS